MDGFTLLLAGQTLAVQPLFETTRHYCGRYLTDKAPEFFITVTQEALDEEQALLRLEADQEGLRPRVFPPPFLERSVIQRRAAELLLERDILMLHGSTVALDGKAYLFTADCGTGKSTHTRLWRQVFGHRAVMVNDDKPFLRLTAEGILACGSPWSGKHGLDTNITVPLAGICILERGPENRIWPISPQEALSVLEAQSTPPRSPAQLPRYRKLLAAVSEGVPLWKMKCSKDSQAALTAQGAMAR